MAITFFVLLVLGIGAAVGWSVLRADSPEDVVRTFQEARSCDEAKEVMHPDFRESIEAEEDGCLYFDTFYDSYDFEYEIKDSRVDGDEATVTVHEKGTALDEDGEDFEGDTAYEVVKVDGEWLILGSETVG